MLEYWRHIQLALSLIRCYSRPNISCWKYWYRDFEHSNDVDLDDWRSGSQLICFLTTLNNAYKQFPCGSNKAQIYHFEVAHCNPTNCHNAIVTASNCQDDVGNSDNIVDDVDDDVDTHTDWWKKEMKNGIFAPTQHILTEQFQQTSIYWSGSKKPLVQNNTSSNWRHWGYKSISVWFHCAYHLSAGFVLKRNVRDGRPP